jgi:hypothetical protein
MICVPCRENEHETCPEAVRQQRAANGPLDVGLLIEPLSDTELSGGQWCDCQHKARQKRTTSACVCCPKNANYIS